MPYTPAPTAPARNRPATFADEGDAFLGWLPGFNDFCEEVRVTCEQAMDASEVAFNSSNIATSLANFKGSWSTLSGSLTIPASVYHNGTFWFLLNNISDIAANQPGVSSAWKIIRTLPERIEYDSRGTLRSRVSYDGEAVLVDGLGMFTFKSGSDEPDDDESCFSTSTGRWLLKAPHWDVVDTWQLHDDDVRDGRLDDAETRMTSAETRLTSAETRWPGRVLFGSAASTITSVASIAQVSFTATVTGAEVGDMVVATPPDALSNQIATFARVTAGDTVTVYLNNPSAFSDTLATGTWNIAVIKTT